MSLLAVGIMSGWLAISAPVVAESQEVQGPSDKQWQERLMAVKESDRWNVGAEIGMDLVRIPGDRPYDVLSANWRYIASSARKQILKGFTPGMMGNKKIHARFFDVMHLGMIDKDPGVRSDAAVYIKMQGLPDFEHDKKGYALWRKQNKNRSAKEIVAGKTSEKIRQADAPNVTNFQKAWQLFFRGDYRASEKLFREVLKTDTKNPHAMNGLGWSLLNQSKHEEAKALLLQALELHEEHWGAMTGLAACFNKEGKLDEAIKLWERIAENSSKQNTATEMLAPIYLEREQYEKAIECYEKLVEWYPEGKKFALGLKQAKEGVASK